MMKKVSLWIAVLLLVGLHPIQADESAKTAKAQEANDDKGVKKLTKESKRSVVMSHSDDHQKIYKEALKTEGAEQRNLFNKLVRYGRDTLIKTTEHLYVNARDLALSYIIKNKAAEDGRADRYLDRSENEVSNLYKVVERFPHSTAAVKALEKLLQTSSSRLTFMEWEVLVRGRLELSKYVKIEKDKKVYVPSSQIHPVDKTLPVIPDKKFDANFPAFAKTTAIYNSSIYSQGIVKQYLVPLDTIHLDGDHLLFSNYRGMAWIENTTIKNDKGFYYRRRHKVSTGKGMLMVYDNNISSDFTKVGRRVYSPVRHTPMKKDIQKDLYIVKLSRHAMKSFDMEASEDNAATSNWPVTWSLEDNSKTFNTPMVVRDGKGYLTSSNFQGMFNVELFQVDLKTGKSTWNKAISSGQQELNYFGRQIRECMPGIPRLEGHRVYVNSNVGVLHCLTENGRILWSRRYERVQPTEPIKFRPNVAMRVARFRNQMPQISGDNVIFSPVDSENLLCVNRHTGQMVWKIKFKVSVTNFSDSFISNFYKKVYWHLGSEGLTVFNDSTVESYDPKSGKLLKKVSLQKPLLARPLFFKDTVAYASDNAIYVHDRKTLEFKRKSAVIPKRKQGQASHSMVAANMTFNGRHLVLWGLYRDSYISKQRPGMLILIDTGD